MSVLLETSLGEIVIDLEVKRAPRAATNFLKLCKTKYYNYCLFHTVTKQFTTQTGDPSGTKRGGESVWGLSNPDCRYFSPEIHPKLKHNRKGTVSFSCIQNEQGLPVAGSQFFITLTDAPLDYLDSKQAIFGQVAEGLDVLDAINAAMVDDDGRPYRDIRILHTIILDDPFDDPIGLVIPDRSPLPTEDQLKSSRIGIDEALQEDLSPEELEKRTRKQEAAAQALTLEMVGDLPFAEIKPPENILFVCKLNPVTRDEDLELIFSRFGKIPSCEIIRDKKTNESLCYAFIEFEEKASAEEAYFKMDNVLIDDRRIHVDFTQSVAKLHTDFLSGQRNKLGEYGHGLEKKSRYRDESTKANEYELVFEHEDSSHSHSQSHSHSNRGGQRSTSRHDQTSSHSRDYKYSRQSRDDKDSRQSRDYRESREDNPSRRESKDHYGRDHRDERHKDYKDNKDSRDYKDKNRHEPYKR